MGFASGWLNPDVHWRLAANYTRDLDLHEGAYGVYVHGDSRECGGSLVNVA